MKLKLYIVLLPCFLFIGTNAHAQWPVGKYRDDFVPSFNYYNATDSWDINGNKINGNGNQFQSYSLNLYNVYGLTRKINIESLLPVVYYNETYNGFNHKNYGLQDLQAGINFNVLNSNFKRYINLTVSGIVPLYDVNSKYGNIGYGEPGAEMKLGFFDNFGDNFLKYSYFNTEVSYRRYFGTDGPDQYTALAKLGISISKTSQFVFTGTYINSMSTNKNFNPLIVDIKDFSLFKTSLDFGQTISRRVTFFAGGFYTLWGRNTGIGYGGNISSVFRF